MANDEALEKIKKLLALSTPSNKHEAAASLGKSHEQLSSG